MDYLIAALAASIAGNICLLLMYTAMYEQCQGWAASYYRLLRTFVKVLNGEEVSPGEIEDVKR